MCVDWQVSIECGYAVIRLLSSSLSCNILFLYAKKKSQAKFFKRNVGLITRDYFNGFKHRKVMGKKWTVQFS